MTPEELLIPRYEIIADYPNSPFKKGDILYRFTWDGEGCVYTTSPDILLTGYFCNEKTVERYSGIFRKLSWWEKREPEDLPKYLKETDTGKVFEPTRYYISGGFSVYYTKQKEKSGKWKGESTPFNLNYKFIAPASEEEYLASLKIPTPH